MFRIFVQWMYFGTLPGQLSLSRFSTGETVSKSFMLWTLGDFLKAYAFKNDIMSKLYSSYSLDSLYDLSDFVELHWAEADYCWTRTEPGSKLRDFIVDIVSHHITFGDYICIEENSDWYKLFTKHPELQLQLIARIAASPIKFTTEVIKIPGMNKYLEVLSDDSEGESEEAAQS